MPRRKATHRPPGTGSVERRGPDKWRVRFRVTGKLHSYSVEAVDKAAAVEAARKQHEKRMQEAAAKAAGLHADTPAFSALLELFRTERLPTLAENTRKTYADSLEAFRRFFVEQHGDPTVDRIRRGHVRRFLTWRKSHPLKGKGEVSARTVAKDRAVLHAVFSYAEELEVRDGNPVARVKAPKSDPRKPVILSADQYEALVAECADPMLKLYALVLGETGARCESEALWLKWSDVDLEAGFLLIDTGTNGHRTKSGKARYVPMTPRLRQAMREHFARFRFARYRSGGTEWVFHHTRSRRHATAGERVRTLRRGFQNAAGRAKLPADLHQHDLRHARVTRWLADGKPAHLVKEAVGHADLRTTMGYSHLAKEHLRELVDDYATRAGAAVGG